MKKAIFLTLFWVLSCGLLQAGDTEITLHSGWSFMDADAEFGPCIFCLDPVVGPLPPFTTTTSVENSPVFGFKVAYFLNDRAGIEGGFSIAPNHAVTTSKAFVCPPGEICPLALFPFFLLERNMVAYQYDANFVYNILNGDVEPYVTIGIGGLSSDLDNDVRNDFTLNFGGGARFWFKKLGLRFEVNDHLIPNYFLTDDTEHNIQVQYGFVFGL
ncbi:MAG TPA: outer membrane beta-barrel protein [Acidobacteriota bacterium]|nr:outer membrane beta-barrel protein [Acidobacteriota bacterium]